MLKYLSEFKKDGYLNTLTQLINFHTMNKILKYILPMLAGVLLGTSCTDEDTFPAPDPNDHIGAVTLVTPSDDPNQSFFNAFNDLAAENIEFVLDVDGFEVTEVESVDIELIYTEKNRLVDAEGNPRDSVYSPILLETVTEFPATINITGEEVAQALGRTVDDFEVGDRFNLIFPINTADGRRLTTALNSELCNEPAQPSFGGCNFEFVITCPSDIPTGTWVETGDNDVAEVTLSEVSPGVYEFSNFNADYFGPDFVIRGVFSDVCNTLTLQGTTEFGVQWRGAGTYDPATQIITFPEVEDLTYGGGFKTGPWIFEYQGN